MMQRLLFIFCLLAGSPKVLLAQTTPATTPSALAAATTLESRASRYFADLGQRQRDIYFAPSDGRAIALLSTAITEFSARRKALIAEAQQQNSPSAATKAPLQLSPGSAWTQEQQALLSSASATKMQARRQRNPALDNAFRRFDAAQLTHLASPAE